MERDFKHTLRSETTFSTIPFLFHGDGDGAAGDMQMKTCDFGRERGRERLCWVNCSERKNKGEERNERGRREGLKKGKGDKVPRPVT